MSGGFKYEQKQNSKGEQVGGIVPHITPKSIANNEPPDEEVLVDGPNEIKSIVPVSGPFVVEATVPTPFEMEALRRQRRTLRSVSLQWMVQNECWKHCDDTIAGIAVA